MRLRSERIEAVRRARHRMATEVNQAHLERGMLSSGGGSVFGSPQRAIGHNGSRRGSGGRSKSPPQGRIGAGSGTAGAGSGIGNDISQGYQNSSSVDNVNHVNDDDGEHQHHDHDEDGLGPLPGNAMMSMTMPAGSGGRGGLGVMAMMLGRRGSAAVSVTSGVGTSSLVADEAR